MRATDISGEYAAQLVALAPAPERIRTLEGFREELHAALPGPILTSDVALSAFLSTGVTSIPLREPRSGGDTMYRIVNAFTTAAIEDVEPGDGTVWAWLADRLTGRVWTMLDKLTRVLHLRSHRNAVGPSGATVLGMRPNFWLCSRGAVIFKAEHKAATTELGVARTELVRKTNGKWNPVALCGLPYLPCYVCAGELLQFVALAPSASLGADCTVHDMSRTYNLYLPHDRIEVVRLSFNLFRVFITLRNMMPPTVPTLYTAQSRPDWASIIVMDDHVRKVCRLSAPTEMYALLSGPDRIPSTVNVVIVPPSADVPDGFTELRVEPVCSLEPPVTEDDMKAAIVAVLRALAALHGRGFVHRDVRWPNVLRSASGEWLLADFELGDRVGAALPERALGSYDFAHEVRHGEPCHPAQDIWQVGQLLCTWSDAAQSWLRRTPPVPSAAARAFGDWLGDADAARRPSAQQALASDWLRR